MNKAADVLIALLIVAIVMVATRPGSKGPDILRAFFGGFAESIRAATSSGGSRSSMGKGGGKRKVRR